MNVTLVLLMSWKHDELSYLIHPSARVKGAAPYYSLNMKDEKARNTFEALFCYMGEELGQMKTRVNNWTLATTKSYLYRKFMWKIMHRHFRLFIRR